MSRNQSKKNKKKSRGRASGSALTDLALVPVPHRDQLVAAYTDSSVDPPQIRVASVASELTSIQELLRSTLPSDVLIRSVPGIYEPRTQLFTASENASNDDQVTRDLIQTAQSSGEGLSNFFEGGLDQIACDWSRLPSGEVAVTHMSRLALSELRSHLGACLGSSDQPVQPVQVETQLRALLRCHLNQTADLDALIHNPNDDGATAILAINPNGFITGLWSPNRGLVRELGEHFDILAAFPASTAATPSDPQLAEEMWQGAIDHAISRLSGLIREAQTNYGFTRVTQILFAASTESADAVKKLTTYAAAMKLPLVCSELPLEEAVAYGLVLGSFETPIPAIDLTRDLRSRADETLTQVVAAQEAGKQMQRAAALVLLLAPLALALAYVVGTYAISTASASRLAKVYQKEQIEATRLKRVQEERNSAIQNITWFQTVVNQIIDRRKGQNGIIRLFDELDARWPKDDPTFYVRELTVSPTGAVEMKGLTKREESVTAFGHSLEFSSGLFTNIAPTIVSANPAVPGSPNMPAMPTGINSSQAPGIIAWTLKATYAPLGNPGAAQVNPAGAVPPTTPAVAQGGAH